MKIKTKIFGEIEFDQKQKIMFKEGLIGFEDIHKYILLDFEGNSPFYLLQSEEFVEIAFILIDPIIVVNEYKLSLSEDDYSDINAAKDNIITFCIVTMKDNPADSTINLLGPVIINKDTKAGKQAIALDDNYSVRHPLLNNKGDE